MTSDVIVRSFQREMASIHNSVERDREPSHPETPLFSMVPALVAPEPEFLLPSSPAAAAADPTTEKFLLERRIREVQPLLVEHTGHETALPNLAPSRRPDPDRPLAAAAVERREDIHISIGRVEIRALPSTQAAPRRSQEAAPSRLETYLQQRGRRNP